MSDTSTTLDKLRKLREIYAAQLPDRVEALGQQWSAYIEKGQAGDASEAIIRAFHTLAGSGASYGYPEVTRICRDIENTLKQSQDKRQVLDVDAIGMVNNSLETLAGVAQQKPDGDLFDIPACQVSRQKAEARRIYILEDDEDIRAELTAQLELYGYDMRAFATADAFVTACKKQLPDVMVIDIFLPDADGTAVLKRLQQEYESKVNGIIVSNRADTRARLRAVRAGAKAFFAKPFNMGKLLDKIDELINPAEGEPFRVMIVDDDRATSDFIAATLTTAGFITQVENNPMRVMDGLSSFHPELILLDLYMPDCDGHEIAEVIRQQENYHGLPIVFLSSESDVSKQLGAMDKGGDDFLTKPVQAQHLIASVTNRVRRYRQVNSLMVRDSLTGLYNHTNIKEILDKEISRCHRHNATTSYALLDIDHFKKVNDTYGHSTGDRVIKLLARLLVQRLRKTDYVGRYGGEEFAVVMPETDAKTAYQVLDKLREDFAKFRIQAEEGEFSSSFSCGIAACPTFLEANHIAEEADKALYVAKQNGRNRIVMATEEQT